MQRQLKLDLKLYINVCRVKNFENDSNLRVAIGNFDGLHIGHRYIIQKILSNQKNARSMVITFRSHANSIFTTQQKIEAIFDLGVDYVLILPENIKDMESYEFIEFLKYFNTELIAVGEGFRFGYQRKGTLKDLQESFNVFKSPSIVDVHSSIISSTRIRSCIRKRDFSAAPKLLGYTPYIQGDIIEGIGQATTQGFSTINIKYPGAIYDKGVYIAKLLIDHSSYNEEALSSGISTDIKERIHIEITEYLFHSHKTKNEYELQDSFFNALVHVGSRPTLKSINHPGYSVDTKVCEAHIVDDKFKSDQDFKKDGSMYSRFYILSFLTREKTFSSHEELIDALNQYKLTCRTYFE